MFAGKPVSMNSKCLLDVYQWERRILNNKSLNWVELPVDPNHWQKMNKVR